MQVPVVSTQMRISPTRQIQVTVADVISFCFLECVYRFLADCVRSVAVPLVPVITVFFIKHGFAGLSEKMKNYSQIYAVLD